MARHDRTGRSTTPGRFTALPHDVLDSPGYLGTSPAARAVLVELVRLHNGRNNGGIALGVRLAATRCNVSPATVARALQELGDAGLVDCIAKGSFRIKDRQASTYRLNWLRCDVTQAIPMRRYRAA
jgi:Fe2+ or Zn2+ uptake regulation protein